jgi:GNAT superfamily N-acetyltransferase
MTTSPQIRLAIRSDAEAVCAVVRRSITESCGADHKGDHSVLSAWLANKTPERVANWIDSPETFAVVAEFDDAVVGFALMNLQGEIRLCYVVPEAQGYGVGRAMMEALEREASRRNLTDITLESTATARNFYLALGFVDSGSPVSVLSVSGQPMRKALRAIGRRESR